MSTLTRQLGVGILVVASFLLGRAQTGRDVARAQTRKPIMMTRIYAGPDGESHAEDIEMKLSERGILDYKATAAQFSSRPAGPANTNWHPGPRRQFVITLSGRAELEVSDGKKVVTGPGHINLIEDTTGKGHITRNLDDRVVITIPLVDEPRAADTASPTAKTPLK
jgi:quercetin dioxygenase-like cupin family protein